MNKFRKAISAGLTATLLASLFTVIAASSVMAAASITSAGSVARGSTTTGTVTIVLTENAAACLVAADLAGTADLTVTLTDDAASAATVDFTGTPTVTAPGSLGASAAVSAGDLVIQLTGTDTVNVEQITIGGLMVATTAAADLGAVDATLTSTVPAVAACFVAATTTATGVVSVGIAAGSLSVIINVDDCEFEITGTAHGAVLAGQLSFATSPELVDIGAVAAGVPAVGQSTLTIDATANNHLLGETVSQTGVLNCNGGVIGTAATVTGRLDLTGTTGLNVFPGENNQLITGATVILTTPGAGTTTDGLPSASVVTYTLPAGIQFSTPPTVGYVGITGPTTCTLSFDRNSCSLTTTLASAAGNSITIGTLRVDVAPTVALGTAVNVTVTTSPARTVVPALFRVAYVARTVVGVGGIPTIFINVNDQNSGMLTLTETTAGFFRAGVGENNAFGVCFTTGEQMTRAPWAVVTSGDLQLLSGVVGAASVQGTLFAGPAVAGGFQSCARWTVYGRAATPLVSTIEIRGADASNVVLPSGANNGPRLNVVPAIGLAGVPGPTLANVLIGQQADVIAGTALSTIVQNAVRAFRSDVSVVAVTQTIVPQGATNSLSGNIKITETLAGQLKATQEICVEILPRTSTTTAQARQDTFFKTSNTNDLPVASTNVASGLLVTRTFIDDDEVCFTVQQQASGTPGELTISNMHLITLADAPNGNILMKVTGNTTGGAVAFEQTVSPARIGNPVAGAAATRLGVTQTGSFTISTKVSPVRRYVTYRFDFGVTAANQAVQIWGATKTGNDWSAFSVVTTRIANASGVVYYHIRHNSATWRSYRANWVGGGAWTPARQARWR